MQEDKLNGGKETTLQNTILLKLEFEPWLENILPEFTESDSGWDFLRRRLCPSRRFLQLRFPSSNSPNEWNLFEGAFSSSNISHQLKRIVAKKFSF